MTDEDEDAAQPPIPEDWAKQLLHFWFTQSNADQWFKGGHDFDRMVTERFAGWREVLRERTADSFTSDPHIALAAVILFDQVPRNGYRGQAEAFATDHLALAISRMTIDGGLDRSLSKDEKLFLYLPFEHSENIEDQRESVRLLGSLNDPELLRFARDHQAIIERFGRFPGRNKALGRDDRAGEAEAVANGANW